MVNTPSHCPRCGARIRWYHNLPLLSWLWLRGRCADCSARIPFRYPLVELLAGLLLAASPWILPFGTLVWVKGVLCGLALLVLFFTDLEHFILPNRVTIGGMALGLLISPLVPLLHGTEDSLTALARAAAGCATGFGTLWLVAAAGSLVFRKEAMGFGDVKLMGAVGAFLGWQAVFFTVVVSSLFGSVAGIALIVAGKRRLQSRIPYGPFIAAAALVWIIWGPVLVNIYLRLLRGA